MKQITCLLSALLILSITHAQQNVGIGTASPDASALLHLSSNSKGILIPAMASADRTAIAIPADGLMVYDTDTKTFWYFNATIADWKELNSASGNLPAGFATATLRHDGANWITDSYFTNDGTRIGIGNPSPTEGFQSDSSMKIGGSQWFSAASSRFLKIGDGNFITIGEDSLDDRLHFKARDYVFGKSSNGYTGNVGIGVIGAPTAKLHVNGSVRIVDGNQAAGRVLTSDASGNASWQVPACMLNRVVYSANGIFTFTVPAGITKIFIEAWSAGGNGSVFSSTPSIQLVGGGGGSGAYANVLLDVTPATAVSITVGSTGGSNTIITYGGNSMILTNGTNGDNIIGPGFGGFMSINNFPNIFSLKGVNGVANLNTVYTITPTTYTEYRGGKGGDSPNGGTGGAGEITRNGFNSGSQSGSFPGGGGGASTSNGTSISFGAVGGVIIRY